VYFCPPWPLHVNMKPCTGPRGLKYVSNSEGVSLPWQAQNADADVAVVVAVLVEGLAKGSCDYSVRCILVWAYSVRTSQEGFAGEADVTLL
jgi:hypothetical protein